MYSAYPSVVIRRYSLRDCSQSPFQTVYHSVSRWQLGIVIQMSIYICRGRKVTMSEPLLYLLHRYAIGKQQRSATVSEIVIAYMPQSVSFKQLWKCRSEILRRNKLCSIDRLVFGFYDDAFQFVLDTRNAMGSRQTVSSELTPREFHPNCRSDRAALIACDGFILISNKE